MKLSIAIKAAVLTLMFAGNLISQTPTIAHEDTRPAILAPHDGIHTPTCSEFTTCRIEYVGMPIHIAQPKPVVPAVKPGTPIHIANGAAGSKCVPVADEVIKTTVATK